MPSAPRISTHRANAQQTAGSTPNIRIATQHVREEGLRWLLMLGIRKTLPARGVAHDGVG